MTPKKLRISFEKLPNNNVYGTFKVFNKDKDVILGSSEWFTITPDNAWLKPCDGNDNFYIKLETIYRLFDLKLEKDINSFIKRLKNEKIINETRNLC